MQYWRTKKKESSLLSKKTNQIHELSNLLTRLMITAIISAIAAVSLILLSYELDREDASAWYISKNDTQNAIRKIVINGGELTSIKHCVESQPHSTSPFWPWQLAEFKNSHYPNDVTIDQILNDLLVNTYTSDGKSIDTTYLTRLKTMIEENSLINPFDNLESGQKFHFDNIKCKLDTLYGLVQPEVNNITAELTAKNQLVTRYLNKSEWSFNLSISAIILTILLSVWQIYKSHTSTKSLLKKLESLSDNSLNTYRKTRPDGTTTYYICTQNEAERVGLSDRGYKLIVKRKISYSE